MPRSRVIVVFAGSEAAPSQVIVSRMIAELAREGGALCFESGFDRPRRGGLAPGALRRVKETIESGLAERIDLAALARLVGLSEWHFSRSFTQSVGLSPRRYIMSRRVSVAADALAQTDRPLSAVALDVGFCDQSHFTRLFVRLRGETPSAFRRRHR